MESTRIYRKLNAIVLLYLLGALVLPAEAKRSAPIPVEPVIHQGVKYVAPHGRADGTGYHPGYIQARDEKSNKLLWELQIYTIAYKAGLERDVQDIFISSMTIVNDVLIVENERDEKFKVDLKTHATEKLK